MKTCRFCNFQQENGDRCDACGSPFSADKVDFSEGLPDLLGGSEAFPDPTASAFPDPTAPQIPDPTVPVTPAVADAPKADEIPANEKENDVPAIAKAPVVATGASETPAETNGENTGSTDAPGTGRKILYSAAASGETVYIKSKGGVKLKNKSGGAAVAGLFMPEPVAEKISEMRQNGVPSAEETTEQHQVPLPNIGSGSKPKTAADPAKYQGWYIHSMITLILSCLGLLCLCGMSVPSLVVSLIAFLSLMNLKNGAYNEDPDKIISRAKKMTMVADFLLVGAAFLLFLIILIS